MQQEQILLTKNKDFLLINVDGIVIYFIGDPHFSLYLLQDFYLYAEDQSHKNNTPYKIMCVGDWYDRGFEIEEELREKIKKYIKLISTLKADGKLHSVLGNHDLDFIILYNWITKNSDAIYLSAKEGNWSYSNCVNSVYHSRHYQKNGCSWIESLAQQCTKQEWLSILTDMYDFVKDLPVIAALQQGKQLFIVTHSNNPLENEELLTRIKLGGNLSNEEAIHAMCARPEEFKKQQECVNTEKSVINISGHNKIYSEKYYPRSMQLLNQKKIVIDSTTPNIFENNYFVVIESITEKISCFVFFNGNKYDIYSQELNDILHKTALENVFLIDMILQYSKTLLLFQKKQKSFKNTIEKFNNFYKLLSDSNFFKSNKDRSNVFKKLIEIQNGILSNPRFDFNLALEEFANILCSSIKYITNPETIALNLIKNEKPFNIIGTLALPITLLLTIISIYFAFITEDSTEKIVSVASIIILMFINFILFSMKLFSSDIQAIKEASKIYLNALDFFLDIRKEQQLQNMDQEKLYEAKTPPAIELPSSLFSQKRTQQKYDPVEITVDIKIMHPGNS